MVRYAQATRERSLSGLTALLGRLAGPGRDFFRRNITAGISGLVLPDVPPPYTRGLPLMPGAGTNSWMLGNGDYCIEGDLSLKQVMLVTGNARLLVKGDFSMSGALSELKVASGATLQLFVAGTNAVITRVTMLNPVANSSTFQYYGLAGNSSLIWNGNAAIVGTIYAPGAIVKFGGGGNNTYDFQGAWAAHAFVLNGHLNFHFDENLAVRGPQR